MDKSKTILDDLSTNMEEFKNLLNMEDVDARVNQDNLLPCLSINLRDQIGDVAYMILSRCTYKIGLNNGRKLREFLGDKKLPNLVEISKGILYVWSNLGWGKPRRIYVKDNAIVLERSSSYEAERYMRFRGERSGRAECPLALGYAMGLVAGITGRRVSGRETKCIAMGDDCCRFELVIEEREVNRESGW